MGGNSVISVRKEGLFGDKIESAKNNGGADKKRQRIPKSEPEPNTSKVHGLILL